MIITALKKKTMMTSESDEEVAPSPQPTKMNTDRLPLGESVVTNRKERSQIMDYVATMNKLRGGGCQRMQMKVFRVADINNRNQKKQRKATKQEHDWMPPPKKRTGRKTLTFWGPKYPRRVGLDPPLHRQEGLLPVV